MYRSGIIAVFLLLASFSLYAQQKISGVITDKTTGEPVAFATIQAKNVQSTLTNKSGEFELIIPSTPLNIVISHLNYEGITVLVNEANDKLKIRITPKTLTLKEVSVGNPAIAIMQAASDKGVKAAERANYGKAFLRQIAYDSGKPSYMNEMFFDAEWRSYGLISWRPTQARNLAASKGLSYKNFSFYSLILSGYLTNNYSKKPLLGRVDSLYTFRLAGTFDQDGQEIAKIICTPKPKVKGQRFEGTYYINTATDNVLKIEGTIKGVHFSTGVLPVSVKNKETIFVAQYRINKDGDNVLDYSLLNTTNQLKLMGFGVQDTDLFATLYMTDDDHIDKSLLKEVVQQIDDTGTVKAMTFDANFWKNNQGIKRTEKEQSAIEILEKIPQVKP